MFIHFHFKKTFILSFFMIILSLTSRVVENSNFILKINYRILKFFSQISVIFVFLIEKKYTQNFIQNTESVNYENFKNYLFPNTKIFPLIIFTVVFDFLANYIDVDSKMRFYSYYCNIFLVVLIEIFLFKKKIFTHHYISVFIYLLIIIYFLFVLSTYYNYYIIFILCLFKFILNAYCYYVSMYLIKYLNINYFYSVYLLGSFIGIQRLLCLLIKKQSFINFNFSKNNMLLFNILYFIIRFCYFYTYYRIIDKLEPIYLYINECFILLISKIIRKNDYEVKISNNFLIIITIITLVSCFIYTEVLELNFCNLNKNIQINISQRGEDSYTSLIKKQSENDSSDNILN